MLQKIVDNWLEKRRRKWQKKCRKCDLEKIIKSCGTCSSRPQIIAAEEPLSTKSTTTSVDCVPGGPSGMASPVRPGGSLDGKMGEGSTSSLDLDVPGGLTGMAKPVRPGGSLDDQEAQIGMARPVSPICAGVTTDKWFDICLNAWDCEECGKKFKMAMMKDCSSCGGGLSEDELHTSLLGFDVVGLFPAMSSEVTGLIVRRSIVNSRMKIDGFS